MDALYDSQAIRRFVGIDLAREAAPDATTLLKFRGLLVLVEVGAAIRVASTMVPSRNSKPFSCRLDGR